MPAEVTGQPEKPQLDYPRQWSVGKWGVIKRALCVQSRCLLHYAMYACMAHFIYNEQKQLLAAK